MSKKSHKATVDSALFKIKEPDKELSVKSDTINHPVFCLKHLQDTSFDNCKQPTLFKQFIQRMKSIGSMDWNTIHNTQRKGIGGYEKINIDSIHPSLPQFITNDVKHLLAFRYGGNNLPFLCHRQGSILHVIFIETKHGDIYDHGSK